MFFLQVLGGVSEEQAAEAAHQQSEKEKGEDMDEETGLAEKGEGDEGDAEDGVEAMDEDEPQVNVRLPCAVCCDPLRQ